MNIKNAIINVLKGDTVDNDDRRQIIKELLKTLPPEKVWPETEIKTPEPISEYDKRRYSAVYGVKRIAEERLNQLTKGNHLEWDSRQVPSLINAAMFCLTEEVEFCPREWPKGFMEKILAMEPERRYAVAGAFISAVLDVHEFERVSREIEQKRFEEAIADPEPARPLTQVDFQHVFTATQEFTTTAYTTAPTANTFWTPVAGTATGNTFIAGTDPVDFQDNTRDAQLRRLRAEIAENTIRTHEHAQVGWDEEYPEEENEDAEEGTYQVRGIRERIMTGEIEALPAPPAPTQADFANAVGEIAQADNAQPLFNREAIEQRLHDLRTARPGDGEVFPPPTYVRAVDPFDVGADGTVDGAPPIPNVDELIAQADRNIVEGDIEL